MASRGGVFDMDEGVRALEAVPLFRHRSPPVIDQLACPSLPCALFKPRLVSSVTKINVASVAESVDALNGT
jgi:hypothetical protein